MYLMYRGSITTLLVVTVCIWTSIVAEFAEVPSNVTIELGTPPPPLRCRHTSSEAFITWTVNGSPVGQFPNITSSNINENGNRVDTLTIPAELQYNGTVVECLALFLQDGSPTERTPIVTILFTTTNSPTVTTTTSPTTESGFDLVPSPLTVAVEQRTATFQCRHSFASAIGWRVNRMPLNTANFQNISATTTPGLDGVITHILSIGTLLEYNGAITECVAFFDGSSPQVTTPVPLFIQDTPQEVENPRCQRDYSEDKLMTLWNLLPTLDINNTDPDILYTVELYLITCGQNIPINRTEVAGNNVTEEGVDLMQIYKAVIAARNNVREARNGRSAEMEEKFMSLNDSTLVNLTRNSRISIQSGDPVPFYYTMNLESLDGRKDNLVINITVERFGKMINMHTEQTVPPNSLWRASILAYECESDRVVTDYELSTHDIQNVVVGSSLPGQISVTGDVISGATATGVLVVVYSLTNFDDVHYIAEQTEGDSISLDVTGLTGPEYGVSAFALENGLPLPGVVASPKNITLLSNTQEGPPQPPPLTEYELEMMSSGVCITCTFPKDSSSTGCVAVVHQRISGLNSTGLVNIEASHKFNRLISDDIAHGCIEGVNLEQYQVGVVDGKMIMELNRNRNDSSKAGAIIGALGAIIVVVALIAVTVAVVVCTHWKRRHKTVAQENVYSEVIHHSGSRNETVVNIESGPDNLYVESAQPSERPPDEQEPLLPPPIPPRVEADGASTPPVSRSAEQHTKASPHQDTSDNVPGDPTYAPVLPRSPNAVPTPVSTEKVSYEDILRFQNQQGQHYALAQLKTPSKSGPVDDLHQVVYIEVKPHSLTQNGDREVDPTFDHAGDTSRSIQEINPSLDSPRISGTTILVPGTVDAKKLDVKEIQHQQLHVDATGGAVGPQGEGTHNHSEQFSNDKQPTSKEENKEKAEQREKSDSAYSDSQQSEIESSDSGSFPEIEQDSGGVFSAPSEEQSDSSEDNQPTSSFSVSLTDNLDEYKSELNTSSGHQTTLKEHDGEFGRTTEKEEEADTPLSSPATCTCSPCSTTGRNYMYKPVHTVERFCMTTEDDRNDEDLIKIGAVHCQDSHQHKNYMAALKWQMGHRTEQTDKDYNNIERLSQKYLSTTETPTTTASQFYEGATSCTHYSDRSFPQLECTNNKDKLFSVEGSQFCTISLVDVASSFQKVQTFPWLKCKSNELLTTVNFYTHIKSMDNTVTNITKVNYLVHLRSSLSSKFSIPLLLIDNVGYNGSPLFYTSYAQYYIIIIIIACIVRYYILCWFCTISCIAIFTCKFNYLITT